MPRRIEQAIIRDGIARPRLRCGAWQYRVWDPIKRGYATASFRPDPQRFPSDAGRTDGCTLGDEWAKQMGARAMLGESVAAKPTLAALGDDYRINREAAGRSDSQLGIIKYTVDAAVAAGINDLTDPLLAQRCQLWLNKFQARRHGQRRGKPASPRTKNRMIVTLRSVARRGVRQGLIPRNPFELVELYKEDKADRPTYSITELRRIVSDDNSDKDAWLFAVLAAYTGLRSETIRSLRWNMIDWETKRWRIPASITKCRMDVRTRVQPELLDILEPMARVGSATILPPKLADMTSDRANEVMQEYLASIELGQSGRSVHAFRHTVAALLTALNMTAFSVMDALGHSSVATSKHYSRAAADYRDQVEAEGWGSDGDFYLRRTPPGRKQKAGARTGLKRRAVG